MTVVDSTPLIYLAAMGRFDLLQALYGRIVIPAGVRDELVVQGAGRWGAAETAAASWIDCQPVVDIAKLAVLPGNLDGGEREVIALAEEVPADLVIMDESSGRQELKRRGIPFIGTVGVLMLAKKGGLLALLKPELDKLRVCGFHLSDRVYLTCLAAVGE